MKATNTQQEKNLEDKICNLYYLQICKRLQNIEAHGLLFNPTCNTCNKYVLNNLVGFWQHLGMQTQLLQSYPSPLLSLSIFLYLPLLLSFCSACLITFFPLKMSQYCHSHPMIIEPQKPPNHHIHPMIIMPQKPLVNLCFLIRPMSNTNQNCIDSQQRCEINGLEHMSPAYPSVLLHPFNTCHSLLQYREIMEDQNIRTTSRGYEVLETFELMTTKTTRRG